jgi:dipeptidyl aminopeptidase/acylaminoacyl peptidase
MSDATAATGSASAIARVRSRLAAPAVLTVAGHRTRDDLLVSAILDDDGPRLYHVVGAGGARRIPTDGPVLGAMALSPEGGLAAFVQDRGGAMDHTLFRLDLHSAAEALPEPVPGPSLGRVLHLFADDAGAWIAVTIQADAVRVLHLAGGGSRETLWSTEAQVLGATWTAADRRLFMAVGRGSASRIAALDAGSRAVAFVPEDEEALLPAVSPSGERLAHVAVVDGRPQVVLRRASDLGGPTRVGAPAGVLEVPVLGGALLFEDEDTLLLVAAREGRLAPFRLRLGDAAWSEPLAGGSALGPVMTRAGPAWITTALDRPPIVERSEGDGRRPLLAPPAPAGLAAAESVRYESADGTPIHAWLLRAEARDAPLLVWCHGGPTWLTADAWEAQIQALVAAGYHVLAPNYRGSAGFGATFRDLNLRDVGGGDVDDVVAGARWACATLWLSPQPPIPGEPYGGYLVLQALVTRPDVFAGGVATVPIADWRAFHDLGNAHYQAFARHLLGGPPEAEPALYAERSPITHLERLKAPLCIIHGENDPVCPIEPVRRFADAARASGRPVILETLADEGHGAVGGPGALRELVVTLRHLASVYD